KNSGRVVQNNVKLVDSSGKIIRVDKKSYLPNTNVKINNLVPTSYANFDLFNYSSSYQSPSSNSVIIYQVYKTSKIVTSSKSKINAHLSVLLVAIGLVIFLSLVVFMLMRRKKS
ncbi:hypothetical protein, partial [Lactiplantibacillus pentosus]